MSDFVTVKHKKSGQQVRVPAGWMTKPRLATPFEVLEPATTTVGEEAPASAEPVKKTSARRGKNEGEK